MRRRDFITLIAGGLMTGASGARAQPSDRPKRIGALLPHAESDADERGWVAKFRQGLQQLGWTEGSNISIDYHWAGNDTDRLQRYAKDLVQLRPDVILVQTTPALQAMRQATRDIPIVFIQVTDPVQAGFVASLARPGGNITGFSMYEPEMGTKWVEMLRQIAPGIARIAILFNPETAPGHGSFFLHSIGTAAPLIGVEAVAKPIHDSSEIKHAVAQFAEQPHGGLFVMPDITNENHRELIVALAAQYRLPAIYALRKFAAAGGLISYGVDVGQEFVQAATYVHRILKGEKPEDLPVQAPTKFELVINLKTAKTLGLTVPQNLQVAADEVIE